MILSVGHVNVVYQQNGGRQDGAAAGGGGRARIHVSKVRQILPPLCLDALLRRTTHLRHVIIADLLARDVHIERANIDSRCKLPHMKQSQVTDAGVKKELSKKLQAVDGDHRQEFEQMAGVCLSVCWPIP